VDDVWKNGGDSRSRHPVAGAQQAGSPKASGTAQILGNP
jgi:hypothetical protein